MGQPVYAIIDRKTFGMRFVSGIVTGVRYTENKPVYTIEFGKNRWESSMIAESKEDLLENIKLPTLDRVKETHGLKIKYKC